MAVYRYLPKGTCSTCMEVELEGAVIKGVRITDGCNGNLQGISRLVAGMDAREAMAKLRGIRCGSSPTSCPDQLAHALEEALRAQQ